MSANVVSFPRFARAEPRTPDAVAVVYDLGCWTVAFYKGPRFLRRTQHDSEEAARAEAEWRVANGLAWHVGRRRASL